MVLLSCGSEASLGVFVILSTGGSTPIVTRTACIVVLSLPEDDCAARASAVVLLFFNWQWCSRLLCLQSLLLQKNIL